MFTRHFAPLFLIFCFISFFYGCRPGTEKSVENAYETISVHGPFGVFNLSTSYISFGAYLEDEEEIDTLAFPVSDGDLVGLYNVYTEDIFHYLRYDKQKGETLSFTFDTIGPWMHDQAGNIVSIFLGETLPPDKISNSTWNSLQSLHIVDSLPEEVLPLLDEIASVSPNLGLFIDQTNATDHVFSRFSPSWLFAPAEVLISIKEEDLASLENVELLWTDGLDSAFTSLLPPFPKLKSLIVGEGDDIIKGLDYLKKLDKLQSLTLVESEITKLDFLEALPQLQRLYLIECDTIQNISGLRFLKELNSLSFLECDSIPDISKVSSLPPLKFFSGPINLDQKTFDEIITAHAGLQVLEVSQQEKIGSLASLAGLEALKSLSLDIKIKDLSPLNKLENLELVIFNQEEWEDMEEEIEAFKTANPEVKVVPGGGFCLGSGWILLLIPLILISRFFFFQRKWNRNLFSRSK